jgi:hypothetical protein
MVKWLKGRLNCLRGKHTRAEFAVRPVGDTYESKCAYCHVPMVRLSKRNWIVKPR